MLDARLRAVAARVRQGSRLADIGTDHAYLPTYLVGQGICPTAIAADIRIGPADAARRTIAAAGLSDTVAIRVGDGLAPIAPDEVDDIVIAGMGGETIVAILSAAPWVKDARYHLVLQPMTRPEHLRRYLLTEGFSITAEEVVGDGGRQYAVLDVVYTAAPPVQELLAWYIGGQPRGTGGDYLRRQSRHLRRMAEGLRRRDPADPDVAAYMALADAVDRYNENKE